MLTIRKQWKKSLSRSYGTAKSKCVKYPSLGSYDKELCIWEIQGVLDKWYSWWLCRQLLEAIPNFITQTYWLFLIFMINFLLLTQSSRCMIFIIMHNSLVLFILVGETSSIWQSRLVRYQERERNYCKFCVDGMDVNKYKFTRGPFGLYFGVLF